MFNIKCLKTVKNCLIGLKMGRISTFVEISNVMAKDVHNALIDVIEKEGKMSS